MYRNADRNLSTFLHTVALLLQLFSLFILGQATEITTQNAKLIALVSVVETFSATSLYLVEAGFVCFHAQPRVSLNRPVILTGL
jgi:hypothetical protein